MLSNTNSTLEHQTQNVLLILLSLLFLPLDTTILFLSYLRRALLGRRYTHRTNNVPKRILVTGVGMTKGLSLARLFHQTGQVVVGADFSPVACGRVSNSISRYYTLQKPTPDSSGSSAYVESLLFIIIKEQIDLWVSCSGVASAVEDGLAKEAIESRTKCKAIQFDTGTTKVLHEKDSFVRYTESLGLLTPATHAITSFDAAESVLRSAPLEREYIMKTVGVSDVNRGNMTLLSANTLGMSLKYLYSLPISEQNSWIMQQYIRGPEYCTHSLVVRGKVKAFVACPSAELLMHYVALPPSSPLSRAMLNFTERFASQQNQTFTGHLSFDFMVPNPDANTPEQIKLYPIECNPRAHTAVALFRNTPGMIDDYLSLLESVPADLNHHQSHSLARPTSPTNPPKIYWQSHDLITNLILPALDFLRHILPFKGPASCNNTTIQPLISLTKSALTFSIHLVTWHDGTYDPDDPLPWWWLTHVYWPAQFLRCIWTGQKWSRCNVSTCKMFEC